MNSCCFQELTTGEMFSISGGFNWGEAIGATVAGAVVGGAGGFFAAGPAGILPGAVGGAVFAGIEYCIVELFTAPRVYYC